MDDVGSVEFSKRINGLLHLRPGIIKLLLTSRPRQALQTHLSAPVHISVELNRVSRDIQAFTAHRLHGLVDGGDGDALARAITERSAGPFLYARLLVDQIAPLIKRSLPVDLDALPLSLTEL
jgi:hypothetical protein